MDGQNNIQFFSVLHRDNKVCKKNLPLIAWESQKPFFPPPVWYGSVTLLLVISLIARALHTGMFFK